MISDCPEDVDVHAELGLSDDSVYWSQPSAIDDQDRVMLIYASHTPGERFPIGTSAVTYLFADDSFNSAYCNFSVTLKEGKMYGSIRVSLNTERKPRIAWSLCPDSP